jgi:hypothetical protein
MNVEIRRKSFIPEETLSGKNTIKYVESVKSSTRYISVHMEKMKLTRNVRTGL